MRLFICLLKSNNFALTANKPLYSLKLVINNASFKSCPVMSMRCFMFFNNKLFMKNNVNKFVVHEKISKPMDKNLKKEMCHIEEMFP